jgi:hypothetical protein
MPRFFHRHGLAIACVIVPLVFGLWGNYLVVAWFMDAGQVAAIRLDYQFRDRPELRPSASPERAQQKEAVEPAVARAELVARHFSGIVNLALSSSILCFIAAGAFAAGFVFVSRHAGRRVAALAAAAAIAVSAIQAVMIVESEHRRVLVTTNILRLAETHEALKELPMSGRVREIVAVNVVVGLSAVLMLFGSLYVAAIRRNSRTSLADLENRLLVIRVTLVLTSALLVAEVLFTRALVDWPLSLLTDGQKSALTPAAQALAAVWGTTGTITAVAATTPAIISWYLDREVYRERQKSEDKHVQADGLEIAPLSTVISLLAVVAPIVASPALDAFKSLLTAVSGH